MSAKGYDDRQRRACNPSLSQLFFVNNVGAVRFEGDEDELVLWQDLATLKLCGENCAQVLHTVSGNIHAIFTGDNDTAAVADFQFRIIDSFGREVCSRRIRYAAELPTETDTEIIFSFTFTCCDELRSCDPWQQFRLQADLLDERLAENNDVWVQDIDWSAVVWEASKRC